MKKRYHFHDLTYYYKGNSASQKFDSFDNVFILFDKIKNCKIMLENAKKKKCFNSDLEEIKKGNPEKNSDHKKNTLYNINMLYKLTQAVISFMMIIFSIISEWLNKLIKGEGLKILTHKQMHQRLQKCRSERR